MIENGIVLSAAIFAGLFLVVWCMRPELRAWIEKPKYRFQENVQSYDQAEKEKKGSA